MPKKKKKKTFKDFINDTKTLTVLFFILLALVIFLIVLCVIKNNEQDKNQYANMVIPVYELNTKYEFNINAKTLSEVDEYVFKIVNYKKNELNKEEIPFKVEIKNDTSSVIKVTKDASKKDLMKDQKSTILPEITLSNKEEESVYYHVKIVKSKGLTRDDLIYITIMN
jgi:predicted lipase